ncbi:MAG: hypothetical protein AAF528_04875 [Cyanobacteria bacterium P01_C01_bin.121]
MNIPAASGQGITSRRSHARRLVVAQQLPSDAAFPRRLRAAGN